MLNITAAVASSLGIIAVSRHGLHGIHGKSYLFLTLGSLQILVLLITTLLLV
jgi:hypothetical protein